jgi:DNA-binding transcriptional ArsR family regulator
MKETEVLQGLAALAHATRLQAFRQLVRAGPEGRVAGDLATALGVPAATLSFHLKELANAGLVEGTPEGRFVRYRAAFERMSGLLGYLTENCCEGRADCGPLLACAPAAPAARRLPAARR